MKRSFIFFLLILFFFSAKAGDTTFTWSVNNHFLVSNFGSGYLNPSISLKNGRSVYFFGASIFRDLNLWYVAENNYPGIQAGYLYFPDDTSKKFKAICGISFHYLHTTKNSYPNVEAYDWTDSTHSYYPVDVVNVNLTYFAGCAMVGMHYDFLNKFYFELMPGVSFFWSRKNAVMFYDSYQKSNKLEDGKTHFDMFSFMLKGGVGYNFGFQKKKAVKPNSQ